MKGDYKNFFLNIILHVFAQSCQVSSGYHWRLNSSKFYQQFSTLLSIKSVFKSAAFWIWFQIFLRLPILSILFILLFWTILKMISMAIIFKLHNCFHFSFQVYRYLSYFLVFVSFRLEQPHLLFDKQFLMSYSFLTRIGQSF